ncbi:MAG: hypothetical protein Barrevirus11_18 [Barrevirus sp.]|uniref:Uncharacterized protein n=1 Tax=Barrevirus sp. TaxID=2487763 RepID=A0A3G4ZQA8_9VIRU|nr:MAG: hypothetical protein Barrevirus11_18 [Barrevirus sp.]
MYDRLIKFNKLLPCQTTKMLLSQEKKKEEDTDSQALLSREEKYIQVRLEQHIRKIPHLSGLTCPYCTNQLPLEEDIKKRQKELAKFIKSTDKLKQAHNSGQNKTFIFKECSCFPNGFDTDSNTFYCPSSWCACIIYNMNCDCRTSLTL